MNNRDRAKIELLDNKIMSLERLYQNELMIEEREGKKVLLMSKGFKRRIEQLESARAHLIKKIGNIPSQILRYNEELRNRELAVEDELKEFRRLEESFEYATQRLYLSDLESRPRNREELDIILACMKRQKVLISAKERAVNNWIQKAPKDIPGDIHYLEKNSYIPKAIDFSAKKEIPIPTLPPAPVMTKEQKEKFLQDFFKTGPQKIKAENNASISLLSEQPDYSSLSLDTDTEAEESKFKSNPLVKPEEQKVVPVLDL